MPNEFKIKNGLLVDAGGAQVTGSLIAPSITGSLEGTASWAINVVNGGGSITVADEGTAQGTATFFNFTGAGVTATVSSNTASITITGGSGAAFPYTGSAIISGSLQVTGSVSSTGGFTGSLQGTASWAENAVTSSYVQLAQSASYVQLAQSASYVLQAVSASFATTASYSVSSSFATRAISSSYSETASYGINIVVSGSISNVDYIQFNTASSVTDAVGRLYYGSGEGVLQYTLANGNVVARIGEDLYQYAYNAQGSPMTKGQVVYISGSQGNRIAVKLASNNAEQGSSNVLGFVAESISAGGEGWVQTSGVLRKLNTQGLTAGQLIFLSSTPGAYTQSFPQAPSHSVRLGFPERIDNTVGSIYIKIDNGYELNELHDVAVNSVSSGDLLVRSGSVWVNSKQLAGSYGVTGSFRVTGSLYLSTPTYNTSSVNVLTINTGSNETEYSTITDLTFTKNIVNVGLPGSRGVRYNVIKTAVQSITDAAENNTYTVRVAPGIYIEDTITVPSWVAIKGDSSISTIVSASNPSASIFVMSDQSMVIDMQIQGSTGPTASAVFYSSPTTPQRNAIAYVENVRFGTNYTNAKVVGSGSGGNCILQCSNVKYGGYTDATLQKSFDVGFHVTSGSGGGIGRMQLRNVTSTNGGVAGTDNNQIFALADAPGCTFIVNGCLLTRATGAARGTAFKVYNGGQLRLTAVNFQRWINGIWAPQTGSAPSIDAIALNFENCTTDVLIEHTGSTGKVQGTDNFLKTQIALDAPLYEVGQDPRRITVGKKGADFTSISASVAYITDSGENNRYVIEVGPGQFTENTIDLTGKPYVSIVGSNIQTTQIFASSSAQHIIKMGVNNEISFLSLANAGPGYSAIYVDNAGDFAQAHKVSIYDSDIGVTVAANATDTQFYGEYIDINGAFSYGAYVSSSNGATAFCNLENYYLFPSASAAVGNYATGPSASLNLYTSLFAGDTTANSIAVKIEDGAQLEANGLDIQDWDYGYVVPNVGVTPLFRVVGSMIHDSVTYDFDIQNPNTVGRYQGVSDHSKINNASQNFYWNFLDDTDGENDITRKLSVTFEDGTHTDATTLIFKGSPMGVMQGGEISVSSGLTITTAAGFGYLQDAIDVNVYRRIDWNNTNLTLSANTNNYIYLNDNGILSASGTAPDSVTNIILGRVVTNNTTVEFIDQSPYDGEHMSNGLSKFAREALGPVYADGSIVTEDAVPYKLDVTAGSYFFAENNFSPSGGSAISMSQYYISASTWNTSSISTVPKNVYASGSELVAMSASYYTKHSLYLVGDGVDEKYFLVINGNQYASLVQAENANLPTIPTYFSDGVVALASVYVQSGSANITQIQDIRPVIGFRAAGVNASSVHGNLLGLSADDHTQYLLVDGGRQMSGDLGLGGNDLYNFASVSGSSITASGANITNIIADTVSATSLTGSLLGTATNAVTASYVLQAVSASFATTASYVQLAETASFVTTAQTASYVQQAQSASYVLQAVSASFASTASFVTTAQTASFVATASWAQNAVSSSYPIAVTGSTLYSANPIAGEGSKTHSIFFGSASGYLANSAYNSNFFGQEAGYKSTYADNSNFFGQLAGAEANAYQSNFLGWYAGAYATNVYDSNFLGYTAGYAAENANNSNFFGYSSGWFAKEAKFSNFSGYRVGLRATSASYSNLFGYQVGFTNSSVNTIGSNNIIIGTNITLPIAYQNGINLGGLIFGSGSYSTTTGNPFSGSTNGRIGINQPDPQFSLDVSGSGRYTNGLQITGSLNAPNITGSLFGTSSWALNVSTASYVLQAVSASFASTASFVALAQTASFVTLAQTASYVLQAVSASLASTASYYQLVTGSSGTNFNIVPTLSGSIINIPDASATARGLVTTGTQTFAGLKTFNQGFIVRLNSGGSNDGQGNLYLPTYDNTFEATSTQSSRFSGLLAASSVWLRTVLGNGTSSTPTTDGVPYTTVFIATNPPNQSPSATVASPLYTQLAIRTLSTPSIISAGITNTSTIYIEGASSFGTNNYALWVDSGSVRFDGDLIMSQSNVIVTGSVISTGGFTGSLLGTSSWAQNAVTASFVTTAQTASFVATASWAQNAVTASYVTGSVFTSVNPALSASYALTASYYQLVTGSSGTDFNIVPTPSGSIINIPDASATARGLVTTGSQTFFGTKIFSGSINTINSNFYVPRQEGAISTATFALLGSGIGSTRVFFDGLIVTIPNTQAHSSLLIGNNEVQEGTSGVHPLIANVAIQPLDVTNGTATTTNAATLYIEAAARGTATITNNYAIWVDSGSVRFDGDLIMSQSNVIVTGSVISTGGFTGSLLGTSSWAQNAVTASFVTTAQTASFVTTAQTASYVTGSVFTSENPALSASYALTASFALNAGGASSITVADEGTSQGTATFLNFTGAGVTVSPVTSNTASINIPGGAGDTFPYTGSAIISGSLIVTGSVSSTVGFTGSLLGTASWAQQAVTASFVTLAQTASFVTLAQTASFVTTAQTASFVTTAQTASYVLQAVSASYATVASYSLATKAGAVANTSFTGNPRKATVTFGSAFPNTNYAVTVTGEDSRTWTIESKLAGSFVINANANTALNGTTYWIATQYNG